MRFEKPHSLSYQLTTRTSLPSMTTVERLSMVELAVASDSGLIGKRVTNSGVAEAYNVAILGIQFGTRTPGSADFTL